MGLFDFLKKSKPEPEVPGDGPSPHYVLAHYALRQIGLSNPLQFLAIAASDDPSKFIDSVLADVVNDCKRKADFRAEDVKFHPVRVKDFPCVVMEMPEPKETAEAYMTALVVPLDLEAGPPADAEQIQARYFTLEKGFSLDNTPRTVLAEWSATAHSNFGDGPKVDVKAFVRAIAESM